MYSDVVLVRYVGGAGGENLCWFLDSILNGFAPPTVANGKNKFAYRDFLHNALQYGAIPDRNDLPFNTRECNEEQFGRYLADCYAQTTAPWKIVKDHYSLTIGYRPVFQDAFILDLTATPETMWVPMTFEFSKWVFQPGPLPDYVVQRSLNHPQLARVQAHFAEHGSVPGHYIASLQANLDIDDVPALIELRAARRLERINHAWSLDTDLRIPAAQHLIDSTLTGFENLARRLGGNLTPEIAQILTNWTDNNYAILAKLGVEDMLERSMSFDEQVSLLAQVFMPTATG